MTETTLQVAQGHFKLLRFPVEKTEKLRAWDAADEYLLNDVADKITAIKNPKILIINDSFGALAVALHDYNPSSLSDSFLAHQATRENLRLNQYTLNSVHLFDSLVLPQEVFDFVFIKAPKTLALLEDLLIRLQAHLKSDTQLIVAGMVKNMPASIWQTVERLVGKTVPSKAVKKARLIYAQPDSQRVIPENPYPVCYPLENTTYQIYNHANVFSRDRLDIGTRFFLEHLPQGHQYQQVVDLGCGNGVVGLLFATKNPEAVLHFVDESFMAVASARATFNHALMNKRKAMFQVGDALTEFAVQSMDLILCNPPFHQQNTMGHHIAERMFRQAQKVLREKGELWVIGNRHLGYHVLLKRYFSQVRLMASNAKFVILKAQL